MEKNVRVGVCVYAENMNTMVKFYRDTLGFKTDWDGGDFAEFITASGKLALFMYNGRHLWKQSMKNIFL